MMFQECLKLWKIPVSFFFIKLVFLLLIKKVLDKRVHTTWRNVLKLCDDE